MLCLIGLFVQWLFTEWAQPLKFVFWCLPGGLALLAIFPCLAPLVAFRRVVKDPDSTAQANDALHPFCFGRRPAPARLEDALRQAGRRRWTKVLRQIDHARNQALEFDRTIGQLEAESWEERFVARHVCIHFGGLAIKAFVKRGTDTCELHKPLLISIATHTKWRLTPSADRDFLCRRCLTHVILHREYISHSKTGALTFWGCRLCAQGHDVIPYSGEIVAVLDPKMKEGIEDCDGDIRVRWLEHGKLFDFHRVDIRQASDSQIEQFVIRVRNDADDCRRRWYQSVTCYLDSQCQVSENSRRALEKTFRSVRIA